VKFPGEIRQTSGCSSKKVARECAKLNKKKEQTEVLEYWEVARNWDGCMCPGNFRCSRLLCKYLYHLLSRIILIVVDLILHVLHLLKLHHS
jgi:hypothetical protein